MIALSLLAMGQFLTGNALLSSCKGDFDARADCIGYVSGVVDAVAAMTPDKVQPLFCSPADFRRGQVRDIVTKYLDNNPAERSGSAAELVVLSLAKAFPCRKP